MAGVQTLYNKTVLFYLYFSFIAVVQRIGVLSTHSIVMLQKFYFFMFFCVANIFDLIVIYN